MAKIPLNLEADIQPVSDFRANTASVLRQVRDTGRPVVLTQRGRGAAVLVDVRVYQSMVDELDELRDIQAGLADVAVGRVVPNEEARRRLLARLG
jgi:prevent-host-death family protein